MDNPGDNPQHSPPNPGGCAQVTENDHLSKTEQRPNAHYQTQKMWYRKWHVPSLHVAFSPHCRRGTLRHLLILPAIDWSAQKSDTQSGGFTWTKNLVERDMWQCSNQNLILLSHSHLTNVEHATSRSAFSSETRHCITTALSQQSCLIGFLMAFCYLAVRLKAEWSIYVNHTVICHGQERPPSTNLLVK